MINVSLTTKRGARATGVFFPSNPSLEQITINAGSILTIDPYAQGISEYIQQNFNQAAAAHKSGILTQISTDRYEVVQDFAGLSVSAASVIVTGKAGSGWKKWRLDNGQLLDVVRSSAKIIASSQTLTPPAPKTPPHVAAVAPELKPSPSANASKRPPCCQIPPGPAGYFLESITQDAQYFSQYVGNGRPNGIVQRAQYLTSALHLEMKLWIPNGELPSRYIQNVARYNSWEAMRQRDWINTFAANGYNHLFDNIDFHFPTRTACALLEYDEWLLKTIRYLNAEGLRAPNAISAAGALTPTTLATIGHAQKALNIYVKYQFCWQRVGPWIMGTFKPPYQAPINPNAFLCALHAPIDRQLLKALRTYEIGSFLDQKGLLSGENLLQSSDGMARPWSKLICLRTYYGFQLVMRAIALATWEPQCACIRNSIQECRTWFEKTFPEGQQIVGPDWLEIACQIPSRVIEETLAQLEDQENKQGHLLRGKLDNKDDRETGKDILDI